MICNFFLSIFKNCTLKNIGLFYSVSLLCSEVRFRLCHCYNFIYAAYSITVYIARSICGRGQNCVIEQGSIEFAKNVISQIYLRLFLETGGLFKLNAKSFKAFSVVFPTRKKIKKCVMCSFCLFLLLLYYVC